MHMCLHSRRIGDVGPLEAFSPAWCGGAVVTDVLTSPIKLWRNEHMLWLPPPRAKNNWALCSKQTIRRV
jgi:hypothetical protein